MTRAACALLLLLVPLMGRSASGADAPDTPEAVADAVLAALAAEDEEGLRASLRRQDPDPWLVARVLLVRGKSREAAAWAATASRKGLEGLPAAIAAEPSGAAMQADFAALHTAEAALADARPDDALAALEARPAAPQGIGAVLVLSARGRALAAQAPKQADAAGWASKLASAAEVHEAAAAEAQRLGWWVRASGELLAAGRAVFQYDDGSQTKRLVELFSKHLAMERKLASRIGMGRAHFRIATSLPQSANADEVLEHLVKAEEFLAGSGDSEYLAKVLATRAQLLQEKGRSRQALELSRRAVSTLEARGRGTLERRFRSDRRRLARSKAEMLLNCASFAEKVGEGARASIYAEQAEAASRVSRDAYLSAFVHAFLLVVQGMKHGYEGAPLAAVKAWDEAKAEYLALQRPKEAADMDLRVGSLLLRVGYTTDARPRLESAAAAFARLGEASEQGWALRWMATLLRYEGDIPGALRTLDSAAAMAHEAGAPAQSAEILVEQARCREAQGRVAEALMHAQAARELCAKHALRARLTTVWTYEAGLRQCLGEEERARELLRTARAMQESLGRRAILRDTAREEARLLLKLGDATSARDILLSFLPVYEEVGDLFGAAVSRRLLGECELALGEQGRAVEHYRAALELWRKMGAPVKTLQARIDLAYATFQAEGPSAAESELKAAEAEARDLGLPEVHAAAAKALVAVSLDDGRPADAMKWAQVALDLVSNYGLDLPEGQDATLRGKYAPLYELGAQAALELKDGSGLFHFIERSRSSTLVAALGGMQAMRQANVPPEKRATEEKARAAVLHTQAQLRRLKFGDHERRTELREKLSEAQRALRDALDDIRLTVHMQADLAYANIPEVETLCGEVGPDEALVLYAAVGAHMVALVIDCENVIVRDLGRATEVVNAVQALIGGRDDGVNVGAEVPLRKLLIEALGIGRKVKRLIISPGEALAFVPFGLLEMDREVVLIQSTATLFALRRTYHGAGTDVLAIGDPDYSKQRIHGRRPPTLVGAGREVDAVGKVKLTREQATEAAFAKHLWQTPPGGGKPVLRPWRAIHFACHGVVDTNRPLGSMLVLAPDAENDGLLETREVFQLQMQTDLVVLSGCETSRAKVIAGDGLSGLVRAFMQAGAPRVLCSLWKVDDESTAELMRVFYARWNAKDPKQRLSAAAALREAQKHVREAREPTGRLKWADPKYWAAWVLWGLPD